MAKTAEKPKTKKVEPTRERVMVLLPNGKRRFQWREVSK